MLELLTSHIGPVCTVYRPRTQILAPPTQPGGTNPTQPGVTNTDTQHSLVAHKQTHNLVQLNLVVHKPTTQRTHKMVQHNRVVLKHNSIRFYTKRHTTWCYTDTQQNLALQTDTQPGTTQPGGTQTQTTQPGVTNTDTQPGTTQPGGTQIQTHNLVLQMQTHNTTWCYKHRHTTLYNTTGWYTNRHTTWCYTITTQPGAT